MLSDKEFFNKFINAIEIVVMASPLQVISVMDTTLIFQTCSVEYARLFGTTPDQLIGLSGRDNIKRVINNQEVIQPIYNPIFVDRIESEFYQVINTQQPCMYLKILNYSSGRSPKIWLYHPVINPDTGKSIGIICQAMDYTSASLAKVIAPSKSKFKNRFDSDKISLSHREKQVIFFFLANYSSQEISDIINQHENSKTSKNSIDAVFRSLIVKFEVINRFELYGKLMALGYDSSIPQSLLVNASAKILTQKPY